MRGLVEADEKDKNQQWDAYRLRSELGAALLGLNRWDEAEPFLLSGYEGMQERVDRIPRFERDSLTHALEHLVSLYEAWNKPQQANHWRARLKQQSGQK